MTIILTFGPALADIFMKQDDRCCTKSNTVIICVSRTEENFTIICVIY